MSSIILMSPDSIAQEFDHPVVPQGECLIAAVDLSNPGVVNTNLFYGFSTDNDFDEPTRIVIGGLDSTYIQTSSVTDYLFFHTRYIRNLEMKFREDEATRFEIEKYNQKLESLKILLFEQPFWVIQIAFKLPTALLEWNLELREKYTGHDLWLRAFSSAEHEENDNLIIRQSNPEDGVSGTAVTYLFPVGADKIATRGLMLSYRMALRENSNPFDVIKKILNSDIIHPESGRKLNIPFKRVFLTATNSESAMVLELTEGTLLDDTSLINRINAKEKGKFYSSDGLITDDKIFQRFALYQNPVLEKDVLTFTSITSSNPAGNFRTPVKKIGKPVFYTHSVRIILSGLIIWLVLFLLLHFPAIKSRGFVKNIKLALLSYAVYAFVSIVFSFLTGFGFVIGIVAMESAVKRASSNYSTVKLIIYGCMTSFLTALVVFMIL